MFFAIIIFFANFAIFYNAQISCDKHPILSNLIISTSLSELSSDAFDIDILRNCEINPHWMKKQNSLPTCESTHRVFEGEDNIRRPLRFELSPSSAYKNDKIKIKSISPSRAIKKLFLSKFLNMYPLTPTASISLLILAQSQTLSAEN